MYKMYTYLFCLEFITINAKLRLNPFLTQNVATVKRTKKQKRHKKMYIPKLSDNVLLRFGYDKA